MSQANYRNYQEFCDEIVGSRNRPFSSPIEDIADEIFHSEIQIEFDTLWDQVDDNQG